MHAIDCQTDSEVESDPPFNDISKVRDFAYEATSLPPIEIVPRPPSPRYLHLREKEKEDSDVEDKSIPRTWYIDSNGTGVSPTSRFRKKEGFPCPDTQPNSPRTDDAHYDDICCLVQPSITPTHSEIAQESEDTHAQESNNTDYKHKHHAHVHVQHQREAQGAGNAHVHVQHRREAQGAGTRGSEDAGMCGSERGSEDAGMRGSERGSEDAGTRATQSMPVLEADDEPARKKRKISF